MWDGMPLGRGRHEVRVHGPADGSTASLSLTRFRALPTRVENETTVVVLIDRKEVFREKVAVSGSRRSWIAVAVHRREPSSWSASPISPCR